MSRNDEDRALWEAIYRSNHSGEDAHVYINGKWKILKRVMEMKESKKVIEILLNSKYYTKGDIITASMGRGEYLITREPQDRWWHKALYYLSFTLWKPSKYYKIKPIIDDKP